MLLGICPSSFLVTRFFSLTACVLAGSPVQERCCAFWGGRIVRNVPTTSSPFVLQVCPPMSTPSVLYSFPPTHQDPLFPSWLLPIPFRAAITFRRAERGYPFFLATLSARVQSKTPARSLACAGSNIVRYEWSHDPRTPIFPPFFAVSTIRSPVRPFLAPLRFVICLLSPYTIRESVPGS